MLNGEPLGPRAPKIESDRDADADLRGSSPPSVGRAESTARSQRADQENDEASDLDRLVEQRKKQVFNERRKNHNG